MAATIVEGSDNQRLFDEVNKRYSIVTKDEENVKAHISERVSKIDADQLLKEWKKLVIAEEKAASNRTGLLEDEKTMRQLKNKLYF
jgi:hypothetical protein